MSIQCTNSSASAYLVVRLLVAGRKMTETVHLKKSKKKSPPTLSYESETPINYHPPLFLSPYNYILDSSLRPPIIKNSILIFDEGHNLSSSASSTSSHELSTGLIAMSISEVDGSIDFLESGGESGDVTVQHLLILKNVLLKLEESVTLSKIGSHSGEYFHSILSTGTITPQKSPVLQTFLTNVKTLIERNSITNTGTCPGLNNLNKLLLKVHSKSGLELLQSSSSYLTLIANSGRSKIIKYICLTPHICLKEVQKEEPSNIIITSGTLSPLDNTASELGLKFDYSLSGDHVIEKNRVFTTCLPRGLRSKILKNTYMNNGPEQFKELGLTISGLINKSRLKGGVMIFFPSYKNMYETILNWGGADLKGNKTEYGLFNREGRGLNRDEVYSKLGECENGGTVPCVMRRFRVRFDVYVEPRDGGLLDDLLKAFKGSCEKNINGGGILCSVMKGKISEGLSLSDHFCRLVIITGLPLSPRKDPIIKATMERIESQGKKGGTQGRGERWYSGQGYTGVNQAVGRVVRHVGDWGGVVFLDERFGTGNNSMLSGWLPKFGKESFQEGSERLRKFVFTMEEEDQISGQKNDVKEVWVKPVIRDEEEEVVVKKGSEMEGGWLNLKNVETKRLTQQPVVKDVAKLDGGGVKTLKGFSGGGFGGGERGSWGVGG
ncbi:hypothetical protein TL16_g12243 [Triparma laevis f. inornata]|uniref:ATP-dependent helicase C-terminal domain-containing protein n=1 Tax=Triparma laevis f. inornata TaxID=1714386 RepID=A0A9W7BJY3_9STRA|nr:hypothetical protein TL16_g12243 [Triparma laevis f. inornata]